MKRKFAAMVLSLTLAVTPLGVFAAENVNSQENESVSVNVEGEEEAKRTIGMVKTVDPDKKIVVLQNSEYVMAAEANAQVEVDAQVEENVAGEAATEDEENTEISKELRIEGKNEEIVIEVAQDAVLYRVPDTEEGHILLKTYSEQDSELPELEQLGLADVKEDDEICILHDKEGKAALLLVLTQETETDAEAVKADAEVNIEANTEANVKLNAN